ncbi:MAG: hypothetical protein OEO77_07050 [Acidimicrobiia bacterium]|nr:hypothetical protein [Acidimicrobiia bacterium]
MTVRQTALLVAVVSVALMLVGRLGFVERSDFGPADLARFESQAEGLDLPDWYGDTPFFMTWSRGDGQVFVTLALDPTGEGPGRLLGDALYRYGRIGFSLLGRLAVGWNADLVPIGLWIVNTIAVAALGWVAGLRYHTIGARSLLIPLNPAVFVGYTNDTAEVLAILAVSLAFVTRRRWWVVLTAVLLGTTREAYLTVAPAVRRPVLFSLVGAGAVISTRLLGLSLGIPGRLVAGTLTIPFVGYWSAWGDQTTVARSLSLVVLVAAVLTVVAGFTERTGAERLAFVSTGLLITALAPVVMDAPTNLLRAAGAIPLLWTAVAPVPTNSRSDLQA